MTGPGRPVIRTPDQRIRVFVSSTLRELASAVPGLRVGRPLHLVLENDSNDAALLERETLDKFAKHYKTGEPMPQALVDGFHAEQLHHDVGQPVQEHDEWLEDRGVDPERDGEELGRLVETPATASVERAGSSRSSTPRLTRRPSERAVSACSCHIPT